MRESRILTWLILPGILLAAGVPRAIGQPADAPTSAAEEEKPDPGTAGMTVQDALVQASQWADAAEAGGPDAPEYAARAVELANRILAMEPTNPQAIVILRRVMALWIEAAEAGSPTASVDAKKALTLADHLISRDPNDAQAAFVKGRVLMLQRRYREAMGYLRKYTEDKGKNDWLALKLLGDIMLMGNYHEMAQHKYETALELNNVEPAIHLGLAQVKLGRTMREEAIQHAQKTLNHDPDPDQTLAANSILATANLQLFNFDAAEEAALECVNLSRARVREVPYDMERLNQLNEALLLTLTVLQTRKTQFPEQADVYIRMAKIIQEQADLVRLMTQHQALRTVEEGVQNTAPNVPPDLVMEVARLQYNVGRTEDAVKSLDYLLGENPDHADARALRERIAGPLPSSDAPAPAP